MPHPRINEILLLNSSGSAAAWTPLSLGAGLLSWYEGDGITQANGSAVSQWDDKSGNGHHLVQATGSLQPLYETNQLNGKPVLRFDATDDALDTANFDPAIGATDFTMAVVAKTQSSLSGYHNPFSYANESPALYVNGTHVDLYFSGDNVFATTLSASTWYTILLWRSGTTLHLRINGADDATTPTVTGSFGSNNPLHVGAGGGAAAWGSDLAAALYATVDLGTTDRGNLESYWRTKYAHY